MSALTKVFVVLLVICSVGLASAVVVWVNLNERAHDQVVTITTDRDATKATLADSETHVTDLTNALAQRTAQLNTQQTQATAQITALQNQITDLNGRLAAAAQDKANTEASLTAAAEAIKAGEDTVKTLQANIDTSRKTADALIQKNNDLNVSMSDSLAKIDALTTQNKFLSEQHAELDHTMHQQQAALAAAHITLNPDGTVKLPGENVAVAPGPINGTIKGTEMMYGRKYATISVGSSDNVSKGMKFYVLSHDGQFLGMMTIQSVQPTESVGLIEGDKVQMVRGGEEVKTQL